MQSIIIVGAGEFGLTASLDLRRRGYSVTVLDPGPVPHPLAASNDTSRMVRMDYGDDELYVELAEAAIQGWHEWNSKWGEELYHEDGFLMATSQTMVPGSFEGGVRSGGSARTGMASTTSKAERRLSRFIGGPLGLSLVIGTDRP